MTRFFTVAGDTWKKQMKSASFWVMVFMPFIIFIVSGAIGYFKGNSSETGKVAIVTDKNTKSMFKENEVLEFVFEDEEKAIKDLDERKIEAYAIVKEENGIVHMDYYSSGLTRLSSMYMETTIKNIQNSLNSQNANITNAQSRILTRNPVISYYEVKDDARNPLNMAMYFLTVFMMYMILILYSNIVIMDVAVEKGTKMLEFIFSSIRPGTYFAGKIFGNFLVILTHALIYIVLGAIGLAVIQLTGILTKLGLDLTISQANQIIGLQTVIFAVLGVLIYMIVAAMLGSLVAKQEDASKMATPIMIIPIVSYILSMVFMDEKSNILIRALSFVPFFSSFFMPMRLIFSDASLKMGWISILVLVASCLVVYLFASKVYKDNILNYNSDKLFGRKKVKKVKTKKDFTEKSPKEVEKISQVETLPENNLVEEKEAERIEKTPPENEEILKEEAVEKDQDFEEKETENLEEESLKKDQEIEEDEKDRDQEIKKADLEANKESQEKNQDQDDEDSETYDKLI